MTSQITGLAIVYTTAYSGADQRKNNASRHWPLWWKMFPFDDVIMKHLEMEHIVLTEHTHSPFFVYHLCIMLGKRQKCFPFEKSKPENMTFCGRHFEMDFTKIRL